MKKIIMATCFLGGALAFTGCETYDELFPEQYHKVLNIRDAGDRNITLYTTGQDGIMDMTIMKSGSQADAVVSGTIEAMTAQEFADYIDRNNLSYSYLPEEYYALEGNEMQFTADERYKTVKATFRTSLIKQLVDENEGKQYVLPLKLSSTEATVNDSLLIVKPEIVVPTVGFTESGYVEKINFTTDGNSKETMQASLALPIDNQWSFDCTVASNEEALAAFEEYNQANNGKYTLLPSTQYTMDASGLKVPFTEGTNTAALSIDVNRSGLQRGYYVLPLAVTNVGQEGFEVNQASKVLLAGVSYLPDLIKLEESQLSGNATMPTDGTGLKGLIDGRGAGKHYHTIYNGSGMALVSDPTYGHYIDIDLKKSISTIMFKYWTRFENANGAPTKIALFTSNDKSTWTQLGETISSGLPTASGDQEYSSKIYNSTTGSFRYFRIAVLTSKGGSMTDGTGAGYFNMGELAIYGN